MASIVDKIKRRIYGKGRGWVFTPKDLIDLGTRAAVDQTLARLAKDRTIRRIDRGVYDYPLHHDKLGILSPDVDSVAAAVSSKTGQDVFASGAVAANNLGLSTQVPARPTYATNGASRTVKVSGRTIAFKNSRAPILKGASYKANATLQALAYVGKGNIDAAMIDRFARELNDKDMKAMINSKAQAPGWLADVITKIDRVRDGLVRA